MQLAMIGLGRMGANMVRRLHQDGHDCVVHDVDEDADRRTRSRTGRDRSTIPERAGERHGPATVDLDHGARSVRRLDRRRARTAARARRHGHRRRQLVVPPRRRPFGRARLGRHRLRRRRRERWRVRTRTRLLPDDRRTRRRRRAPDADLRDRWHRESARASDAGPRRSRSHPTNTAGCTAARAGPDTSSRWSTTASSTG
jgi:hypothetical protein